ncbi:hypothetical protein FRC03_007689 [Tulasnella sp. 419]|nr:hypothetical protein FRC03_007689 [Tulasnella sp. 419]
MTPSTHRAVKLLTKGKLEVTQKPITILDDECALIKVVAVALNPTDWKHADALLNPGDSAGCDFAGDIVEIGRLAEGKGFKVGDSVAGFVRGGYNDSANGAFQEYLKAPPELIWHIPKELLSYEEAAPMGGIALSTAVFALYYRLGLPQPDEVTNNGDQTILIWSGATSVGIYAIRLAKLSGYKVVTVSSPKNIEFLEQLGADVVFDYKDPEAPAKIKQWSGGSIRVAFDTISEHGSTKKIAQALGDQAGKIITLLPVKKEGDGWPSNIELEEILIYTSLKKGTRDFDDMAAWYRKLSSSPELVAKLKVAPLKHWEGGLNGIPEAVDYLRSGQVSAQKIVLRIQQ